jgi:hypothetical protein
MNGGTDSDSCRAAVAATRSMAARGQQRQLGGRCPSRWWY